MLHLYDCVLGKLYDGQSHVDERHRHRYEVCVCVCSLRSPLQHILSHQVNPTYVHDIETKGMAFVGHDEEGQRMEILELKGNLLVTIAMRLSLTVHNLSQKCFEWHCYIHVTCVSSPPPPSLYRSPIFRRDTVSSRVPHSTHETFSSIPRTHSGCLTQA